MSYFRLTNRNVKIDETVDVYPSIIQNFAVKVKKLPKEAEIDHFTQIREFIHFINAIASLASSIPHFFVNLSKVFCFPIR